MYRDLQEGRLIEADQIIGDLLERAVQAEVPTPLLAAAYVHLKDRSEQGVFAIKVDGVRPTSRAAVNPRSCGPR